MNEDRNLSEIPASACTLVVGEFELGDNGDGAKSAPVKLTARSGKAIEHWFWGRVIHDMAGMHMHKPRLPIDYVHDAKEVIGYLNKFDTSTGDLVTSGALVPFKDTDRATEITHKLKAGVPYEASINFGGDGIKVQEVAEGERTEVNGSEFDGPGVVVREWPLRGVAICPYGADMNTESASALSSNKMVFSASVVTEPEAATEEGSEMSESVEVEATVETPEAEQVEQVEEVVESVEEEKAEDKLAEDAPEPVEADKPSEEDAPEPETVPEAVEEDEEPEATLSREEFAQIADEFGDAVAAQVMREGGDYEAALKMSHDALGEENEQLKKRIAELEARPGNGRSAPVTAYKEKAKIFNTEKK